MARTTTYWPPYTLNSWESHVTNVSVTPVTDLLQLSSSCLPKDTILMTDKITELAMIIAINCYECSMVLLTVRYLVFGIYCHCMTISY